MKFRLAGLLATAAVSMLAAQPPAPSQHGRFVVHLILHAIGEEKYEIAPTPDGLTLTSTIEYADRGNTRRTNATLRMRADYTPVSLEATGPGTPVSVFGSSPFALQMAMMRYWQAHQKPARMPLLVPGKDGGAAVPAPASAAPIEIVRQGRDTITIGGKKIPLDRYTIANLMFGREILWTDAAGDLAAAMTFAGGLPMEIVREDYEPALQDLYRSGVAQEMANLAALGREAPPERDGRTGAFAIAGATVIDGTGAAPIADAVVIVRNGRIAAVGPRSQVTVPRGTATIHGTGKTLLAGLWEMHTHFSGVEFGPALLAAGITTARDCGGEFDYLVAQRDAIDKRNALGPRLLLAGLVDAGGEKAFGHVIAETPDAGRAVVRRYHDAGFQQIKLYTFLTPDVIRAIADEAHRLGMSVTGHVPRALTPIEGVQAGMDQINHLSYVNTTIRDTGTERAVEFFRDHHTVIDPTTGWGEMASHAKSVEVASFEPGILRAPFVIATKFQTMGGTATVEENRTRLAQNLAAIGALHRAGVPVVPGSDTSLVGYGLHREIELYVEAGMTPMDAIQSATIVSAKAMKLDAELGTVEAGKRADLILVDGDPLADIRNLRKISRVVTNGRVYDPAPLWRSVGFQP
jgi:imidazolonepropionase-like amidohydrolase